MATTPTTPGWSLKPWTHRTTFRTNADTSRERRARAPFRRSARVFHNRLASEVRMRSKIEIGWAEAFGADDTACPNVRVGFALLPCTRGRIHERALTMAKAAVFRFDA